MRIINTSDLMGPDWDFIEPLCKAPGMSWHHISGLPANALERRVPRPNLARWRAAWQSCAAARRAPDDSLLVSHLPGMTMAISLLRRRLCARVPQVAFAFNFTALPQGGRLRLMTHALADVAEFVVFSQFERGLYSEVFGLDPARLRFLPWAMDPPVCAPAPPAGLPERPYLCAIGGEARDYRTLAEAMRRLPAQRMVIVGRPYSVAGIDFPPNVTVFTNLPGPATWAIARDSIGMAIPLVSDQTVCGHVTLVGAQRLGIPLVITRSVGVADYVADGETAALVTAGDAADLARALARLAEDPGPAAAMATRARTTAGVRSDPAGWAAYFEDLHRRHADGTLRQAR